jgi:hypothetical protein
LINGSVLRYTCCLSLSRCTYLLVCNLGYLLSLLCCSLCMKFTDISYSNLILNLLELDLLLLFFNFLLLFNLFLNLFLFILLFSGFLFFNIELSIVIITGMLLLSDLSLEIVIVNCLTWTFTRPP